jgi:short-chain fatty acids transporter
MTSLIETERPKRGLVSLSVALFERWMPDPFVIAIALTLIIGVAAWLFAPNGAADIVVSSWYTGIFAIVAFAFQMVLILVTGHALANAPPVKRGLQALVGLAATPNQAIVLTFLVCGTASFLNWGFGLVVAAMLSREVAAWHRLDFGWLVAAAYSGWVFAATGFSGSIVLTQATKGNALNIIEKLTGKVIPVTEMVFRAYNIVPNVLIAILVPIAFILIRPRDEDIVAWSPEIEPAVAASLRGAADAPARRAERWPVWSWLFAALGFAYLGYLAVSKGIVVEINIVIFVFLLLGIALHGSPVAYVAAVNAAAKQVGSMILLYPIYGGILGILNTTGLAALISKAFIAIASAHTLPFWSYLCSLFITFLIPSAGGHWAVQGPVVVPAAMAVGASVPATAIAVAAGENVAYMLQPFFALPVVAIAGIGIQRVLGYTVVTFLISGVVWTGAILLMM